MNLLSGHPDSWGGSVSATDLEGKTYAGKLAAVSSDPAQVASGQDIILLAVPGYLIEKTLSDIRPYIGDAAVGSVVSSTGFFFFAHKLIPEAKLFGFQRVPYIARVKEYGSSALLLGYKDSLLTALENIPDTQDFLQTLGELFGTPVLKASGWLDVSLSNSNPILHTGRLYTMFSGKEDAVFDHNILFYREWTDEASQKLIDMDAEFFALLRELDVHAITPLLEYYESHDAASLTRKISSIPAFQAITSPMKQVSGGWKADFASRYFTEDFPFGLRWIKELAVQHGLHTPVIDEVYNWGINRI